MKMLILSLAGLAGLPILAQEVSTPKLQLPAPREIIAAQVLAAEKTKYDLGASTRESLDRHQQDHDSAKSRGPIEVTGQELQRDGSTIHLKGNAEIRTGSIVLHADEADYHIATGAIEARGNVQITPR